MANEIPDDRQQLGQVDEVCDDFESAMRAGEEARIEQYLNRVPPVLKERLFSELLHLELEAFEKSADQPAWSEYRQRFPEFSRVLAEAYHENTGYSQGFPDTVALSARDGADGAKYCGPYQLIRQIGQGGMGTVYLAEQNEPVRRLVAIKMLREDIDSQDVIARFDLERQALFLMESPNIARIYNTGTWTDGRPYFVMEWVPGEPITQYCQNRRLDIQTRLELFVTVCRAVQHAHTRGIIHRDLKPANILVTEYDGKPVAKVIDFGLAKAIAPQLTLRMMATLHGQLIGTVQYMSPEQTIDQPLQIDARADVYSLGAILYELLVGCPPIDTATLRQMAIDQLLLAIREGDTPLPSNRVTSSDSGINSICQERQIDQSRFLDMLRGELDWIAMKALAKEPDVRYQTPLGLAEDVSRYLFGEPVEARPPSFLYRVRTLTRRYQKASAIALGALFLLIAAAAVCLFFALQATQSRQNAVVARAKAEEVAKRVQKQETIAVDGAKQLQSALDKLRRRKYLTDMVTAELAWKTSRTKSAVSKLIESYRNKPDLTGFEWHFWDRVVNGRFSRIDQFDGAILAVAFSPNSELYAAGGYSGLLRIYRSQNGALQHELKCSAGVSCLAFAPDSATLLAGDLEGNVWFWDSSDGRMIRRIDAHGKSVAAIDVSPDGEQVVTAGMDGRVKLWKSADGSMLHDLRGGHRYSPTVSFSVDGSKIAWSDAGSSRRGLYKVWDIQLAKTVNVVDSAAQATIHALAFSPITNHIVAASADGTLKLWQADAPVEEKILFSNEHGISSVTFARDGNLLACSFNAGDIGLINPAKGGLLTTLRGHNGHCQMAFSPDGKSLLSGGWDGSLRLWNLQATPNPVQCKGHHSRISAAVFNTDDSLIATASPDKTIRIWDVASGEERLQLKGHTGTPVMICFRKEGNELLSAASSEGCFRRWNLQSGKVINEFGKFPPGSQLVVNPQGTRAAAFGIGNQVTLWDLSNESSTRSFNEHHAKVTAVAFQAGSDNVLSGDLTGLCMLWKTADATVSNRWELGEMVRSLALTKDGTAFACNVGISGVVLVQEVAVPANRTSFTGHSSPVSSLCFSPDGSRLATASTDQQVQLWDRESAEPLLALSKNTGNSTLVLFSTDGTRIASFDDQNNVTIWNGQPRFDPKANVPAKETK